MTHSPITSTSICVRRKQSSASPGLHTTGSFSLNEVLSRHARQPRKRLDQPVIPRVGFPVHRLQPAGPVHMRHCGDRGEIGDRPEWHLLKDKRLM